MSVKYSVPAEKRAELDALSLEIYKSKSRWVKLVEEGRLEVQTRDVKEVTPATGPEDTSTDEERTRTVKVPVTLDAAGKSISKVLRRLSVEEVEAELREHKAFIEAVKEARANYAKAQEEAKAQAKLEADVAARVSGSAV